MARQMLRRLLGGWLQVRVETPLLLARDSIDRDHQAVRRADVNDPADHQRSDFIRRFRRIIGAADIAGVIGPGDLQFSDVGWGDLGQGGVTLARRRAAIDRPFTRWNGGGSAALRAHPRRRKLSGEIVRGLQHRISARSTDNCQARGENAAGRAVSGGRGIPRVQGADHPRQKQQCADQDEQAATGG